MTTNSKIANVSDEVCETCTQFFEGECRAFLLPHSDEEHRKRANGKVKCTPNTWGFGRILDRTADPKAFANCRVEHGTARSQT